MRDKQPWTERRGRSGSRLLAIVWALGTLVQLPVAAGETPTAVPTFESVGLTWGPVEASAANECTVRYRKQGATQWNDGYPLYFDGDNAEYRGSIVHLAPATTYEVELSLPQTSTTAAVTVATWSEDFPIGQSFFQPEFSTSTLDVDVGGTPAGYALYAPQPGSSATIDVEGNDSFNIKVNASYVIIRGLTLKNAARNSIRFESAVHDVVIEENDISGWGRVAPNGFALGSDGALQAFGATPVERIIVQRNVIHHPRSDSNSWAEERDDVEPTSSGWHPKGPQVIRFHNSLGNHVIRYNTIVSDADHYFEDAFGGSSNCSQQGFPNRDSDIYGNWISHCWDDAIESEGANRNVRIWGNYIDNTLQAIATRSTSVGPLYIWRNVYGSSRRSPLGSWDDDIRGRLHKAGASGNCDVGLWDRGVYDFHNTALQPEQPGLVYPTGAGNGPRGRMFQTTTRNNIFQVANPLSPDMYSIKASEDPSLTDNDFDYDLYNGQFENVPLDQEINGVLGVPDYDPVPVFNPSTGRGVFTLAISSPGHDAGAIIPNFNDHFVGLAPDMGAHEAGTPPMEFGIAACSDAGEPDADGDQAGAACDCNDSNNDVWTAPDEVPGVLWFSSEGFQWNTPPDSGGRTVVYDVLRSSDPSDFGSATTCIESDDGSDNVAADASPLAPGGAFFYLVRADNDCPMGAGSLGTDSSGIPRGGQNCP